MKKIVFFVAALLLGSVAFSIQAQSGSDKKVVSWQESVEKSGDGLVKLVFTGTVAEGYHTYTLTDEYSATEITDLVLNSCEAAGDLYEVSTPVEETDEYGEKCLYFYDRIVLAQEFRITGDKPSVKGTIFTNACTGGACKAEYHDFEISLETEAVSAAVPSDPDSNKSSGSLWSLIIQAIMWGLAMLLTPCVFPMVPMTVSFFLKGSGSPVQGRFKAFMYGTFIVLLYPLPIALLIVVTRLIGGVNVTADIFNWLATHWLPNIIFFIVFMVFAASFFGAFEITLPSSVVNKADAGSDKKGLAGIFFMALTLVLVSFSCTGPIVGNVLIQATSTGGTWWHPIIVMLAFSIAFALPFTILAFFPSLLKNLPKSGGWLNTVKVVMGFIELALGFKFLMTADQTYHWGLLDREVYLALWIVIFSLLGFYLLGKIRLSNDDPVEKIGVSRLSLAIAVFSFVVYLVPGMFGAPLKAISGYLPPMSSQDFVLGGNPAVQTTAVSPAPAVSSKYDKLHMPHGLKGYFTLNEALEASKATGKPVFVDITGHGCNNCREMESRVWSDPRVLKHLNEDFVLLALYVDDKMKLEESDWLTDPETGKVYKDMGRVNSWIAINKFGANAQPTYALLDSDGNLLAPTRGYDLSVEGFLAFLEQVLD